MPNLCTACGATTAPESAMAGPGGKPYCVGCFVAMAGAAKRLTSAERAALKAAVVAEMAGVLPRGPLQQILEDGYAALLLGKTDFDEVVARTVNQIEQQAGLAMCTEVLGVLQALQATLAAQEADIREKIRKLAAL